MGKFRTGLTSIVIVTADSGYAGVEQCIARALTSIASVEIIVADNASHDGSIERIAAQFAQIPQVRFVYNAKNIGFGPACNRAAEHANGDALLFLNPDCMVEPDTVSRLRKALDGDARIGLVGALQIDAEGRVDAASRRRDPLLCRALMSVTGLARLASRWPALAGVDLPAIDAEQGSDVERVDVVSGALMLISRIAFARVHGFDEGYFLHCEDIDLCRRVRDAGFDVVCADRVHVLHVRGGSSRHRPVFVAWHKHRGMWRWFVKFDPTARNPLIRAVVWCGIWAMFGLKLPLLLLRRLLHVHAL